MVSNWLRRAIEVVILLEVGASPWLFGSVHPLAQFFLCAGLFTVAMLWIARILLAGRVIWNPCSITLGLALMCAFAVVQMIPVSQQTLAIISPAANQLREELLPSKLEHLPSSSEVPDALPAPTLSLSPYLTRQDLLAWIGILFLFTAIRSNLSSPGCFYRLAIVAVINGVVLSLLGLGQWLSSPRNVVFWTIPSEGTVFGPFICRNHFAYYINLSIGLGFGLLLSTRHFQTHGRKFRGILGVFRRMLQDPALMWIGSALIVMVAGLLCSLSRGGMGTCAIAAFVCLAMHWRHAGSFTHWASGLMFVLLGLAFATWLGAGVVGSRIATVWETNVLDEGRGPVWNRVLGLFPEYPIFGTGMGTFSIVEPLTRTSSDSYRLIHMHMHNDFLEALIEGGLIQLGILLGLLFLIFRAGFSAFRQHRGTGLGCLVLGAVFGLTAITIHSTVDFGLHVPAVMLLTVTICAMLTNAAEWRPNSPELANVVPVQPRNFGGAFLQIAIVFSVALFLLEATWRSEHAERYRLAANAVSLQYPEKKIAYLEAGVAYTPDNPFLQVAAGEAHRLRQQEQHEADLPENKDFTQAFHHFLKARNECPLLVQPHLYMAAHTAALQSADSTTAYLKRACKLDPSNATIWYFAGLNAWQAKGREDACACWKRSLQCDATRLNDILTGPASSLEFEAILNDVLPPDPKILYEAFLLLEKTDRSPMDRQQCLVRAAKLLESVPSLEAPQFLLLARIQARLLLIDAATASYQRALALSPRQNDWRLEFSECLVAAGKWKEAREELMTLKGLTPHDRRVNDLDERVRRAIAADEPGANLGNARP